MSRFMDARLAALEPYVPGEQPRDRAFIKLNTNENPYPPSPEVLRAIDEAAVRDLRLYSDPTALELRKAIAERYGLRLDQVAVSNGSDEILAFAFQAFNGEKGVAFPKVSYGFYPVFANLFGLKARAVPLKDDFTIDVEAFLEPGENVVIANPNAPTGLALPLCDIERMLAAHPDDVVLVDEAYVDFGAESAVGLIDRYENLLVVQTFSKSRSLAGGRIGFALGSAAVINDLETVRNSFNPYNLGRLPILAGAAAMRDEAYFRACCDRIAATRDRTAAALKVLGCAVTDSRANFLFVNVPDLPGERVYARLREKGILVRWFDADTIRDWLRISVGTDEDMAALVKAVKEIIEEGMGA
ncbi:MAG: histidinol-phosphate transaminase [Clostridiales bacterium]|nr:histidinol-phosphate transaminase [Clostridiales bacterium]